MEEHKLIDNGIVTSCKLEKRMLIFPSKQSKNERNTESISSVASSAGTNCLCPK